MGLTAICLSTDLDLLVAGARGLSLAQTMWKRNSIVTQSSMPANTIFSMNDLRFTLRFQMLQRAS
jgi:hypothetical protein